MKAKIGGSSGGTAISNAAQTIRWNLKRGSSLRLLEVRGELPSEVKCPILVYLFDFWERYLKVNIYLPREHM